MAAVKLTFIYNLLHSIKSNRTDHRIFIRPNIVHDRIQTFVDEHFMRAFEYLKCPKIEIKKQPSDLHRTLFDSKRPASIKQITFKCTHNEFRAFMRELLLWRSVLSRVDRVVCDRYIGLMKAMFANDLTANFPAGQHNHMRYIDFGKHTYLNVMLFDKQLRTIAMQWHLSMDSKILDGRLAVLTDGQ